jgi:hypothetical protein
MMVILKRNDTKKPLKAVLSNESGPIDLTGCTVRFIMSDAMTRVTKINREALIQDAGNGTVWVVFEQGDTDTPGTFKAEFKLTYSDYRVETFPDNGYIFIEIQKDLG